MKKVITVTPQHIHDSITLIDKGGEVEDCCPIAVALREQGFPKAIVCAELVQLGGSSTKGVPLPAEAVEFVRMHDAFKAVRPFTFELRA